MIDTFHSYIQNPIWIFTTSGNHVIKLFVTNGICKDTIINTIVINPIPPLNCSVIVTSVTCFGSKNGSLTAVPTGGSGSYNYQWGYGNTTYTGNTIVNADTGKYILTVTDSVGCKIISTVSVNQPLPLKHKSIWTNTHCGLANGRSQINETGGTLPYKFTWAPSGDTTIAATGLTAGNYVVTIKDKNGCIDTAHIAIGSSIGVNTSIVKQTNSCLNSSSGTAQVFSTGNGAIHYLWVPTGGNLATANNLAQGSYIVTATDSLGCKDTTYLSIGLHAPITINAQQKNVSCFNNKDGVINLSAIGAASYIYQWNPLISQGPTISGLDTGIYGVVIKDTFGCSIKRQFAITQPNILQLAVVSNNTTCGLNNGSATAMATGGTTPYHYAWSYGYLAPLLTGLPPLTTDLLITDSNGCRVGHYGITIAPSHPLIITLGNDVELCPGDSIRLSPGGYYYYKWQDGSTLPFYTATRSGSYQVTVKDTIGCNAIASVTIRPICQDLLFPDAFTPNNDRKNDAFGPIGTLQSVKQYSLKIFDRWGRLIFVTSNAYTKWDGKVNNIAASNGSYVWIAEYTLYGKPRRMKKGAMVLIR